MTRRLIWLAIPILLIVIYLQAAYFPELSARTAPNSDGYRNIGVFVILAAIVPRLLYSIFGAMRRRHAPLQHDPRADVVFSGSVADAIPMAIAMIGGAIGAYMLLSQESPPVLTWVIACGGIALAISGVVVVLMHIVSGPFRLSLSAAGLDYGPFKCGPISWRDIRRVDLKRFLSTEVISIEVADSEKYFARGFPKIGRNPGRYAKGWTSPFVISPKQIHVSSNSLLDAIYARLEIFGLEFDPKETE